MKWHHLQATHFFKKEIPLIRGRFEVPFSEIYPQLKEVDLFIRKQVAAFDPALVGYLSYVLETRGKNLRPALVLLGGGISGSIHSDHIKLASVVELIHLASLVHDDILDHAEVRRGKVTAHTRWGPETAVLLGDCLFAHALKLCTSFENRRVAERVAEAASDLIQGEILQTQRQFDLTFSMEDYFRIIGMKTAALFEVSTELSALLNQVSEEKKEALRRLGRHLGVAYQIYDDCLDLVGTENQTGKTLGTDLVKGKLTLPVLFYLQTLQGRELEKAHEIILSGELESYYQLIQAIHTSGQFRRAIESFTKEIDASRAYLSECTKNVYRDGLEKFLRALKQQLDPL
ncbi:MAG: polyprenyl synthetase family protein [Verrucomicrobiia bacterium]